MKAMCCLLELRIGCQQSAVSCSTLSLQGRRLKVSHVMVLGSAAAESPTSGQRSQEVLNGDSSYGDSADRKAEGQDTAETPGEHPLLEQPPSEWFGKLTAELVALQPQKLGKVSLNSAKFPCCLTSPANAFMASKDVTPSELLLQGPPPHIKHY